MPASADDQGGAATRCESRLAEITAELTKTNRPLMRQMSETEFRRMIERMAEHQLLYEEFGHR